MADFEVNFTLEQQPTIEADFSMTVINTDHDALNNRDMADQHPISAITGLQDALDNITSDMVTEQELSDALATKQDTLTAGTGISIENNVISNTQTSAEWGNIRGTLSDQTDLQNALNAKQNTISDLQNIRNGAALGATSLQPYNNISLLTNNIGYITADALNDYATTSYVDTGLAGKQNTLSQAQMDAVNSGANTTNIAQIATNTSDISTINGLIPAEATTSNQLADKAFVNSSIATNTANFIGTFANVPALEAYSGTVTNNDYAFVVNSVITDNGNDWATFAALDAYDKTLLTNFDYAWVINGSNFDLYRFDILNQTWGLRVSDTPKASVTLNTAYNRYKATVNGTTSWDYEYTLNNSSFTATQWAAINSGITSGDVTLIGTALQPNDNISLLTNNAGYITSASIATLTDVNLTSLASGQTLVYDSVNSKWVNSVIGGAVDSVNGYTGTVVLAPSDLGITEYTAAEVETLWGSL